MRSIVKLSMLLIAAVALSGCGRGCGCSKEEPKESTGQTGQKSTMSEKIAASVLERAMKKDGDKNAQVEIAGGTMRVKTADGEAEIKTSGDGVTIKSKEGNLQMTSGPSAKIPENFPKDLPVLEGATLMQVVTSDKGNSVLMQSEKTLDDIAAHYGSVMKNGGWEQVTSMDLPNQKIVSYKKDKRAATVMVMDADGKRTVQLTDSPQ